MANVKIAQIRYKFRALVRAHSRSTRQRLRNFFLNPLVLKVQRSCGLVGLKVAVLSCTQHPPGDGETASRSTGDDPCPLAASQSDDRPILSRLAEHNPDLRELEIIAAKFESAFHRNAFVKPMKQVFSPW